LYVLTLLIISEAEDPYPRVSDGVDAAVFVPSEQDLAEAGSSAIGKKL